MQKKLLLIIGSLLVLLSVLPAQTNADKALLKNAEKEYHALRYTYALPFYTRYLSRQPEDSVALLHLANAYRLLKQQDSAAKYYQKYLSLHARNRDAWYRYAEILATQKKYTEAVNAYANVQSTSAKQPDSLTRLAIRRSNGFADQLVFRKDSLDHELRYLKLNTAQQDFSPFMSGSDLVFVSNRYRKAKESNEFGWDGLPFAQFFCVKNVEDMIDAYDPHPPVVNTYNRIPAANHDFTHQTSNDNDMIQVNNVPGSYQGFLKDLPGYASLLAGNFNMGPACIAKDGTHLYYTRNSESPYQNKYHLEIWEAVWARGEWQQPRKLPFVKPGFDFYHPAISSDGKTLYFCSNLPGGYGGSDIYAVLTSRFGATEKPQNLGNRINTAGNELFPVMNGDSLYFSSDGHPGLGGLDIYYATQTLDHSWNVPTNTGYPVNSDADDFGLVFRKYQQDGFFSSNRQGSDDLFYFKRNEFHVQVSGTMLGSLDQRRLPATLVTVRDSETAKTDSLVTDLTGNYRFRLKPGSLYLVRFQKEGYITDSVSVDLRSTKQPLLELAPTVLVPLQKRETMVSAITDEDADGVPDKSDKCPTVKGIPKYKGCPDLAERLASLARNIFFTTASTELQQSSFQSLTELVDLLLLYPAITLDINGYTDNKGDYRANILLSRRRAEVVRSFLISKGVAAKGLRANGYGPANPVASNTNEAGRASNRRVELKAFF